MPTLCTPPSERSRKTSATILQAVQRDATQAAIAASMGCSESTISRLLSEHLDKFAGVLAHAGLKVVPVEHRCVSPETYAFLTATHERVMRVAPSLIWDTEA